MSDKMVGGALTAAALALAPGVADATTVINVPLAELVSGNSTYNGQFNISSILAGGNGQQYRATSATITAYGYSDALYNQTSYGLETVTRTGYYEYQSGGRWVKDGCSWLGSCSYYYVPSYATGTTYQSIRDVTSTDTLVDQLRLAIGNRSATDSTDQQALVNVGTNYVGQTGGYYTSSTTNLYERNFKGGSFGDLNAVLTLNAGDLDKLNSSQLLDYTVSAPAGRFNLNKLSLSLELSAVTGVPEPTTWMMMIAGFGVTGGALRAQRRRRAATKTAIA